MSLSICQTYLLRLSSTLASLLDGRPVDKKAVKALARRASLNAVPFDLTASSRERGCPPAEGPDGLSAAGGGGGTSKEVVEAKTKDTTPVQRTCGDPFSDLKFLTLSDSGDAQCDLLFSTVYRLSHARVLQAAESADGMTRGVSYGDCSLVEALDHWIGRRGFLSMCLVLDVVDSRWVGGRSERGGTG